MAQNAALPGFANACGPLANFATTLYRLSWPLCGNGKCCKSSRGLRPVRKVLAQPGHRERALPFKYVRCPREAATAVDTHVCHRSASFADPVPDMSWLANVVAPCPVSEIKQTKLQIETFRPTWRLHVGCATGSPPADSFPTTRNSPFTASPPSREMEASHMLKFVFAATPANAMLIARAESGVAAWALQISLSTAGDATTVVAAPHK